LGEGSPSSLGLLGFHFLSECLGILFFYFLKKNLTLSVYYKQTRVIVLEANGGE
jgi:hypothetical protein